MAGGPYNIPRNTKGEGRFFYIFSAKALIFTVVLALIGFVPAYFIGKIVGHTMIGLIVGIVFGVFGFLISSFKIPESQNFEITRKAGGEYIYKIILRYIKFKQKRNRIYTCYTEEKEHEQ